MRLLVVGAGSTGGYFGGRLGQAGRDVTFLVRPARAAQLRESGLRIVSPRGDATLAPKLVTADEITQPYDLVLFTLKGFQLEEGIVDLAAAIGAETMILLSSTVCDTWRCSLSALVRAISSAAP